MKRSDPSVTILFISLAILQGMNQVGFYFACSLREIQTSGAEMATIFYTLWFGFAYFIPAIMLTNGYVNRFAAVYEDAGIGFQLKRKNDQASATIKASATFVLSYFLMKYLGGIFCTSVFSKDAISAGNVILGLFWDRPLLCFWIPFVYFYLALHLTGGRIEEIRRKNVA
ncbi:MAG: hypothetical protein HGA31_01480 [Candidatus Moranbacteria bacterium]|nr:hypothetical protein [Candidatus Moranbacteria bacterium]